MTAFERIAANRAERSEAVTRLDTELARLVATAMDDEGHTWQEVAAVLGVSKQRVYQLRAEGKPS
ncbi:helix-turn-helix domain-containing protein [Mycolicibacterium peregrinum]